MTDKEREFWTERAAIREHLGGATRADAERGADEDLREREERGR